METVLQADTAGKVTFNNHPLDDSQLSGKRIIVTGGSGGIGSACCRRLVSAGAYVVIADKNIPAQPPSSSSLFIPVDVTSWESQIEMFRKALDWFPGNEVDCLITCAGIASKSEDWNLHPSTFPQKEEIPPAPDTACLDVNLLGTMYSVHIATKYCSMVGGSIILLGSTSGFRPLANKIDYSVAKWGVRGFFRNIRAELPQRGIRVNMLAPFWVPTALTQSQVPELERQGVKLGRLEDALAGVVRMVVDESMNGECNDEVDFGVEADL